MMKFYRKKTKFIWLISFFLVCEFSSKPAEGQNHEPKRKNIYKIGSIKGRNCVIDPDGEPLPLLGINHTHEIADLTQPDWNKVGKDYVGLGCTMIAGDSNYFDLPFIAVVKVVKTSKFFGMPGSTYAYEYPDVFNPEIQNLFEEKIKNYCIRHRNNKNLIGYFWDDTPCWDLYRTRALRQTDWVSEIRKLPSSAPGKQKYIAFLKERYEDNIENFNSKYGLSVSSFRDLLESDFKTIYLSWGAIQTDDEAFLGLIAETYYKTLFEAHQKYDSEHLLFGEKYLAGDYPDVVLKAASKYIDVLSIQPGDGYIDVYPPSDIFDGDEFDRLYEITNKPIFICDHQISFATKKHPATTWTQLPDEKSAAEATLKFVEEAYQKPYIVGYVRCQYVDKWDVRRNALKMGLLKDDLTEYKLMTDALRKSNRLVKKIISEL